MDWEQALKHLEKVAKVYGQLPYSSAWFVIKQLENLKHRYDTGERSKSFYEEIMSFEL